MMADSTGKHGLFLDVVRKEDVRRTPPYQRSLITWTARILLAAVFALSGLLKIQDPGRFLLDVQAFQLVPYPLAFATSLVLPWLELFCAAAVLFRWLERGALLLLSALTGFFIAAIISAEVRGLSLDCGCFGEWLVFPNAAAHVGFNLLLIASSLWLFFRAGLPEGRRRLQASPSSL